MADFGKILVYFGSILYMFFSKKVHEDFVRKWRTAVQNSEASVIIENCIEVIL
jgi:hypothetical protein